MYCTGRQCWNRVFTGFRSCLWPYSLQDIFPIVSHIIRSLLPMFGHDLGNQSIHYFNCKSSVAGKSRLFTVTSKSGSVFKIHKSLSSRKFIFIYCCHHSAQVLFVFRAADMEFLTALTYCLHVLQAECSFCGYRIRHADSLIRHPGESGFSRTSMSGNCWLSTGQ